MAHLSSGESSKPQSLHKAHLLGELADANMTLAHKEEELRPLVERMQRLEDTQKRLARERRGNLDALEGIICTMGVKKKKNNNNGECKMWKLGTTNTNHQRLIFLLLSYLVL